MRGLMVEDVEELPYDVGNWNEEFGSRQGTPATPQAAIAAALVKLTLNIVVLTPLMLVWLKTLKPSAISCTLRRSLTGMFFVTRGSSETVRGRLKVSRPTPGARSV